MNRTNQDTPKAFFRLAILVLTLFPVIAVSEPAKSAEKAAQVRLKTSEGDIVIELNKEKAPITVDNFLGYVENKHYNGTVFHRVIDGFMIQGGGFAEKGGKLVEKSTGDGIKNEADNGLRNVRGSIAMARTSDLDSATVQFFINVVDNNIHLDYPKNGGYTVFGKVVKGMDVVDKIKSVPTGVSKIYIRHPLTGAVIEIPTPNVPVKNVVIQSAAIVGPEIDIQQPLGSSLVDGTSKKRFGSATTGMTGNTKTFTIRNSGSATLKGLAITKSGVNAADFIVTSLAETSIARGKSTTFKVSFKPAATGTRQAVIHVKSNDPNENPFDIKLTGLSTAR